MARSYLEWDGETWQLPPSKTERIVAKLNAGDWHNADANESED